MNTIDTDYLVVGAGAAGMAFVDALIADGDAEVVMVDRQYRPGGHWNHAYPFVRLHQPSAIYGVNSRRLGTDSIDALGSDAGLYERATGAEICGYFQQVLNQTLLPSGQVRFFGMSDYLGDWKHDHVFRSRMTGTCTRVNVRKKVVDTTYLQATVPATHKPAFTVDGGVRFCPAGGIVDQVEPPGGYTVLGGGKTAMDVCYWLLAHGVDPERIRWVRPRDTWALSRRGFQPLDLMHLTIGEFAAALRALAEAESLDDLYRRLEAGGQLRRFDKTVVPTMFRGAILSDAEFDALVQIKRVVRKGHVKRITSDRILLAEGEVETGLDELHVDCTASGFRSNPAIPIFGPACITTQGLVGGFTTFSAALIGYVEAVRGDDREKNALLQPVSPLNNPIDWINAYMGFLRIADLQAGAGGHQDLAEWLDRARLNLTGGMSRHMDDPRIVNALDDIAQCRDAAVENGRRLLETMNVPV
ncbi:MAG: hypothetical protein EPN72_00670 [Nevskiaceae bacterium]|nr:MAG: hypothetical protein EPN63_11420 [Nevskiaceae bacterium]TBR74576.1 MAG: hypothetical protein EPN72_00670 [Nevskiaceae bacterium]